MSAPRTWASPQADRLESHRDQITTWLQDEHLQLTLAQELLGQLGLHIPKTTLERFVWRLGYRPRHGRRGDTVRMAPTTPGEVAGKDFESLGLPPNPEAGRRQWIWGLSLTLRYRRHSQDANVETGRHGGAGHHYSGVKGKSTSASTG